MGLDIALGLMILTGAVRGWFRGFVLQAIRLGSVVGSVYAAGPVRDWVRPHVASYLASIPPNLLDRMLWWASAVACYIATVGLGTLCVKLYRRRPYGEPEPNRADQFAGFLLSIGKGVVVASFLVGAVDRYALTWARQVSWADDQLKASQALVWNQKYRPADQIWAMAPVQHFVGQVRTMGVASPSGESHPPGPADRPPVQTASRPPRLDLPAPEALDPRAPDFTEKFDEAFRRVDRP